MIVTWWLYLTQYLAFVIINRQEVIQLLDDILDKLKRAAAFIILAVTPLVTWTLVHALIFGLFGFIVFEIVSVFFIIGTIIYFILNYLYNTFAIIRYLTSLLYELLVSFLTVILPWLQDQIISFI